jgi:MerR family mercuric resistance operon transcriptional regulator
MHSRVKAYRSRNLSIAFPSPITARREPEVPTKASLDSVDSYRVYAYEMEGLTRNQLAQRAHVSLETIRFYEEKGLLPVAPRTASGYRKFSEQMIERLAFVKRVKALGFSLEEIRELLHLQDEQTAVCVEVRDLLQTKLSAVREKKADLEKLESHLSDALGKCNRALKQQPKSPEDCPALRQMADSRSHSSEIKMNSTRRVAARGR